MDRRCDHGQHDRGSRRERQGCPRLAQTQGTFAENIYTTQVWFTANVSLSRPKARAPYTPERAWSILCFAQVFVRCGATCRRRGVVRAWGEFGVGVGAHGQTNAKLDAKNVNAACVLGLGAKTLTRRECSSCIIHYVIRYSRRDRAAPPAAHTYDKNEKTRTASPAGRTFAPLTRAPPNLSLATLARCSPEPHPNQARTCTRAESSTAPLDRHSS